MNKRALGADGLLLITAAIWGFGFVAQRSGMKYVGPFAYNGIRFILGSLSLFPVIALQRHQKPCENIKKTIPGIIAAGSILFIAVTLQQTGIMFTTAGNAGFITGLYVVLTPFFGIFLGRKTRKATWLGALLTLTGLYFVSIVSLTSQTAGSNHDTGFGIMVNPGDIIIAVCAIFWACHVLIIDRLVEKINPIILSSGQFLLCGIFSLTAAFLAEPVFGVWLNSIYHTAADMAKPPELIGWTPFPALLSGLFSGNISVDMISGALVPILYGGLASVGIAYTLQVVAQKNAPPAHAAIILSLEGCFAAFGGVIILNEPLGAWTVLGFGLMLGGMIISQRKVIFD